MHFHQRQLQLEDTTTSKSIILASPILQTFIHNHFLQLTQAQLFFNYYCYFFNGKQKAASQTQGEYSLDSTKGMLPAQMPEAHMVLNGEQEFTDEKTDQRLRMSQAKTHYHTDKFPNITLLPKWLWAVTSSCSMDSFQPAGPGLQDGLAPCTGSGWVISEYRIEMGSLHVWDCTVMVLFAAAFVLLR